MSQVGIDTHIHSSPLSTFKYMSVMYTEVHMVPQTSRGYQCKYDNMIPQQLPTHEHMSASVFADEDCMIALQELVREP